MRKTDVQTGMGLATEGFQMQSETSILKVLLKQYNSPTGPTNVKEAYFLQTEIKWGLKVELDLYYVDTNSSKKFKSLS